jgi:predicted MFS family arabinose efflux permease
VSLRGNRDFTRLWWAATISIFGSLVTRTALPWTAILVLGAGAREMAWLRAADLLPGLALGLGAGVLADRIRRRPILIATDLARALVLVMVPLAWALDLLRLELLFAVALAGGCFGVFFDVANLSYLPTLVAREDLARANGRLQASASVSEVAAFGLAGWLVQLLSAPLALLIDAASFLASAAFVARIRAPEAVPGSGGGGNEASALAEVADGLRTVWRDPLLRPLAGAATLHALGNGIVGTVYLLYVTNDVGFAPGPLGMIFAVGGASAFFAALAAPRIADSVGMGRAIVTGFAGASAALLLLPLAPGPTLIGAALLVAHQLFGDFSDVVYGISAVSLRQSVAPRALLGRVNGSLRVAELGAALAGTLLGGVVGETLGLRGALLVAAAMNVPALAWLFGSRVRGLSAPPRSGS